MLDLQHPWWTEDALLPDAADVQPAPDPQNYWPISASDERKMLRLIGPEELAWLKRARELCWLGLAAKSEGPGLVASLSRRSTCPYQWAAPLIDSAIFKIARGDCATRRALLEAFRKGDSKLRIDTAVLLRRLLTISPNPPPGLNDCLKQAFIGLLTDEDVNTRHRAACALREATLCLDDLPAITAFLRFPYVPETGAYGVVSNLLRPFGPAAKEAVPPLAELLRQAPLDLQAHLCYTLGGMGSSAREAVPALLDVLATFPPDSELMRLGRSPNFDLYPPPEEPAAVVTAILQIRPDTKTIFPKLFDLLQHTNPMVTEAARDLIDQLGPYGQPQATYSVLPDVQIDDAKALIVASTSQKLSTLEMQFPEVCAQLLRLLGSKPSMQERVKRHLRVFRVFVQCGSYRRAGAALELEGWRGVTHHVLALERDLGTSLVQQPPGMRRLAREPTAIGRALAEWIELYPDRIE